MCISYCDKLGSDPIFPLISLRNDRHVGCVKSKLGWLLCSPSLIYSKLWLLTYFPFCPDRLERLRGGLKPEIWGESGQQLRKILQHNVVVLRHFETAIFCECFRNGDWWCKSIYSRRKCFHRLKNDVMALMASVPKSTIRLRVMIVQLSPKRHWNCVYLPHRRE